MRILMLTQYYDPEPMTIPHELARGMVERGHEVTAITGFPNYPLGRIYEGYKQRLRQWDKLDGVKVLRLPLYPDHSLSAIKRSAYYLSLAFTSAILGIVLGGPADIIFVFHPHTMAIPAWWIGLLRRIPFVLNIQDMYPESLTTVNISNKSLIYKGVDRFTKFVYSRACLLSVISPGFRKSLINKGVPEGKIEVILNWADEKIYCPMPRDESLAAQCGMAGCFNVVYAGNMGPPQGLMNVIEAATILSDTTTDAADIQFVFIGDGNEKSSLMRAVNDRNLRNVRFLPRQPASKMPFFYALADVLLVHLIDDPLFEITIPCKTQSYLACGRPLLMCLKGDAADLVLQAGAGLVACPSVPLDLARAVKYLYEMPPEKRQAMGDRGRDYFLKNLTIKASVDKYEAVFRRAITDYKKMKHNA